MLITTGSRIHMGLIDLNGFIGRIDGGLGLAITEPGVEIEFEHSQQLIVEGPQSNLAKKAAQAILKEYDLDPVRLDIQDTIPRHVGLGSGTQIALASAKSLAIANGLEISDRTLAEIVGRGGTSGIGTAAFINGGFIVDGGHSTKKKREFLPSSEAEVSPPPVVSRIEFPDWNIRIFIPDGKKTFGTKETNLFRQETPIPMEETQEISHIVLMNILPSLKEENFESFKKGISAIQSLGFKQLELSQQPESRKIIDDLEEIGVAAGLSSWGPAVFAISPEEIDYRIDGVASFATEPDAVGSIIET